MAVGFRLGTWPTQSRAEHEDLFVHLDRVYAYVGRRIGPEQVVEDICSEVFAAALRAGRPRGEALPWLLGIARRKIADSVRRRASAREASLQDATLAPEAATHDHLVRTEEARMIRALVDALDADQREAILLFYVEDLTAKQVGQAMGRSEHAVNSLLQRARQRLRENGRSFFEEGDRP